MDIYLLKKNLNKLKDDLNRAKGARDELITEVENAMFSLESKKTYLETLNFTVALLQKTSEYQRKKAGKQIEELGTYALQFIFGVNYRLEIKFAPDSKKPEAEIWVVKTENGGDIYLLPEDDDGGGIVDVVCLALRMVLIKVYEPFIDGPILLDEPGKHLSEGFNSAFGGFLKDISASFDRQIIIVTHNRYLAEIADKRFDIEKISGASVIL